MYRLHDFKGVVFFTVLETIALALLVLCPLIAQSTKYRFALKITCPFLYLAFLTIARFIPVNLFLKLILFSCGFVQSV